jgi:hypothetical protein
MSAVGSIFKALISPVGAALGLFGKPKAAAPAPGPVPLPTITPRSNAAISDALARRRGSAANQLIGGGGAESSAAPKKTLLGN